MKKAIIFSALGLLAATATAEVLTPSQALNRALGESPAGIRKIAAKDHVLTPAMTIGPIDSPELYVMTPSEGSLLIVSAESETPALLGYSDDSSFDPQNIPDGLSALLERYAMEIQAIRAGIAGVATGARADYAPILPLCKTTWNQDRPYNNSCPKLNGEYTMTGCVATAMAQVLKAIEWPPKCNGGTETYKWANGNKNLSLNFDEVTLNWSVMKDNYTSSGITAASKAVATLMQAVAYAGHMNFSPSASGTYGVTMAEGLINHFDFDCTLSYEQHDWYAQAEWEDMIYKELSSGFPVYYDGVTPDNQAGHAFVVDGYAGDGYYHLNWGWGGMSDGYYRLTALDPSSQGIGGSTSGYNFSQGIIVGLKKGATTPMSERPLIFACWDTFGVEKTTVSKGSTAKFTGGFFNMGPLTVSKVTPGVKFVNEATGEETQLRSSASFNGNIATTTGFNEYTVTMQNSLPEGTYTVYPTIYDRTSKQTYDMRGRIGGFNYLIATVAGSTVTFSTPDRAAVKASNVKLTSKVYTNTPFSVSATITNSTTQPYNGYIIPAIFSPTTGSVVKVFESFALEAAPNSTQQISLMCGLDATVGTGSYDFCLMDENGKMAGNAIRITVSKRPADGVMKIVSLTTTDTSQNNLTFEAKVTCTEGYFSAPMYVVIFPRSGQGANLDLFMTEPLLMSAGETKTVTVSSTFASGKPGTTYSAVAYYVNSENYNVPMEGAQLVQFTLTSGEYGETDSIEEVSESAEPTQWFDIRGRRVVAPSRGIYIGRQGDKVIKRAL